MGQGTGHPGAETLAVDRAASGRNQAGGLERPTAAQMRVMSGMGNFAGSKSTSGMSDARRRESGVMACGQAWAASVDLPVPDSPVMSPTVHGPWSQPATQPSQVLAADVGEKSNSEATNSARWLGEGGAWRRQVHHGDGLRVGESVMGPPSRRGGDI